MRKVEWKTIERWPSGHHNPHRNILVRYRGKLWELESGHGSSDDVDVYLEGDRAYAISTNSRLGYVGLSEYLLSKDSEEKRKDYDSDYVSLTESASAFNDRDNEIAEILGPRVFDLQPLSILRKMLPYLGDG